MRFIIIIIIIIIIINLLYDISVHFVMRMQFADKVWHAFIFITRKYWK